MKKYKCKICNKNHDVYYSSQGGAPKIVVEIRMNEQTNRIEELSDTLLVVDNKSVFLKGIVIIETTFTENLITHEAWIEFPIKEYVSQIEEAKGKPDLVLFGTIASILPFHKDVLGLNAKWILDSENQVGEIRILMESELKKDQQKPITEERLTKMMELIYHPELYLDKKVFDKSFRNRFKEIIEQAKTEFIEKNRLFLIDISNQKEVLFQLVSSEMTSIKSKGTIGIHLSNDKVNENYLVVKKQMAKICEDQMFNKLFLDEIETYQKNYQFTDEELWEDIKQILELIFQENMEDLEINISEV